MNIIYDAFRLMLTAGLAYVMGWVLLWVIVIGMMIVGNTLWED